MSDIYLSITETPAVVTLSQPVVSGALSSTVTVANTVTVALDANSLSALENVTVTVGAAISVSNFPATQVVSVSNLPATQPVSLASLPGSTVTVANFPATQTIVGTVTVGTIVNCSVEAAEIIAEGIRTFGDVLISGTVTANLASVVTADAFNLAQSVRVMGAGNDGIILQGIDFNSGSANIFEGGGIPVFPRASSGNFPISGTVTANNPSGALTTRFGSVTTANTAQITSAVTNTSRKYLLAQNISAGTVTIGIGFSPTTTQGIQLTAGAGLTFDSFCPTGAVFWLGAVTGAAFTILEG